ncbi:PH domain-containing protein [Proteinivorax hydrogeniformans]|uniref:PH domain-containing protein n=1 Tax=Proteinivorax hydrogeniformans TaxID=1826727 RepID=A0AAU8HS01_9FIRM
MDFKRPKERIHPKAVKAWRVNGSCSFLIYLLMVIGYLIVSNVFGPFPKIILWIAIGLALIIGFLKILVIPSIRMRYWCYEIREHEVDIQSGLIVIQRSLIPMARIQHIDTEQGPILRYFKLATLSISTAGTTHKIPALKMETALKLRDQISALARISNEEV